MTQLMQLTIGLTMGVIFTQVVTRSLARLRSAAPARHIRSRLAGPRLLTAAFADWTPDKRVRYSPSAEQQRQRLGVNRELVETALSWPTHRIRSTRLSLVRLVLLERDFGSHTLRLIVEEPWTPVGAARVKQVKWWVQGSDGC